MTLTQKRVLEKLDYDPETGRLSWRQARVSARVGALAGAICRGYRVIAIDGKTYLAHRLAWLYTTGSFPKCQVDHVDGDKDNNRWVNLRDVARVVNQQNQRRAHRSNKSSGLIGATWSKSNAKWQSGIKLNGRYIYLGLFDTPMAAHDAYISAKRRLHEGCTI